MRYPRMPGERVNKKKKESADLSFSKKERKAMTFLTDGRSVSWLFGKRKGKNAKVPG